MALKTAMHACTRVNWKNRRRSQHTEQVLREKYSTLFRSRNARQPDSNADRWTKFRSILLHLFRPFSFPIHGCFPVFSGRKEATHLRYACPQNLFVPANIATDKRLPIQKLLRLSMIFPALSSELHRSAHLLSPTSTMRTNLARECRPASDSYLDGGPVNFSIYTATLPHIRASGQMAPCLLSLRGFEFVMSSSYRVLPISSTMPSARLLSCTHAQSSRSLEMACLRPSVIAIALSV
ncbi:hypothetical protein C8Q80DRAFT_470284 [Daedaleopsis nitida]|nr:hypothetical protein C8Q80DRAFT_470284 [Daedaleopsis nitida]